jgi:glutathione S-transferase
MATETATMFGSRLSPFVEKVWRALALKKVDCRLVEPRGPGDFGKWNPQTRKMPALRLGGERLHDSTFIVRRLDELFPEPPLRDANPETAAAQELLEDWSDEALYWYGMALRWSKKNAPATMDQIFANLPAPMRVVAKLVAGRQIAATTRAQGLGRLPEDVVLRELAIRLDDLVVVLGRRPFFYAERPSVADLAVYGQFHMLCSGPTPAAAALVRERPALVDHMRRVEAETGRA